MIQVAITGDPEAAFHAARRGFVVLGMEEKLAESVERAGGVFIFFGEGGEGIRVVAENPAKAAELMVKSADIVIIAGGSYAELVKQVTIALKKPFVEGSGKDAVDEAVEKMVRYNLFGKK